MRTTFFSCKLLTSIENVDVSEVQIEIQMSNFLDNWSGRYCCNEDNIKIIGFNIYLGDGVAERTKVSAATRPTRFRFRPWATFFFGQVKVSGE